MVSGLFIPAYEEGFVFGIEHGARRVGPREIFDGAAIPPQRENRELGMVTVEATQADDPLVPRCRRVVFQPRASQVLQVRVGVGFVAWARKWRLLSSSEARRVRAAARDDAEWLDRVSADLRELRGLLHRMFDRVADGELPDGSDLRALENYLDASAQKLALGTDADGGVSWQWADRDVPLADVSSDELGEAFAARTVGAATGAGAGATWPAAEIATRPGDTGRARGSRPRRPAGRRGGGE